MDGRPHTLRAFLLAPLIVPVLWSLVLGLNWRQGPSHVLGEVGVVVVSSLPFIYGAVLLAGAPAYWLIRCRWQLKLWHPIVIGSALGAAVLPMAEPVIERTVG